MMLFVMKPGRDGRPDIGELVGEVRDWQMKAARGEREWICADCSTIFGKGMPEKCPHGHERCTALIKRDKAAAKLEGGKP